MQGVIVDADVGGKDRANDLRLLRQRCDRLTVRGAAGAIDRGDVERLEIQLLGGLGQRRTAGAIVLDLVAQIVDLGFGACLGEIAFEIGGDVFIGFLGAGFDLADLQQHGAEGTLDRRGGFAGLQREGGVGDSRVDDVGLGDGADVGIAILHAALFGQVSKAQALGQTLGRGGGFFGLWKYDLAQFAFFRRAECILAHGIGGPGIGVADRLRLGEVGGREEQQSGLAIFRRTEKYFAGLEIFGEFVGAGRGDIAGLRRGERDKLDGALFGLVLHQRFERGVRHLQIAADGLRDLPAQHHITLFGDEAAFAEAGIADHGFKTRAIELAVGAAKGRVAGDAVGDILVGKAEAQLARQFVERGFGDKLTEQLAVEAERARLIVRDRPAHALTELLQLVGVIGAELLDRDFGAADLGDRIHAEATEDVADAPDREGDDQAAHDDAHHGFADPGGCGFMNSAEHGRYVSLKTGWTSIARRPYTERVKALQLK